MKTAFRTAIGGFFSLLLASLLLLAPGTSAQAQNLLPDADAVSALACLTKTAPAPQYPKWLLERGRSSGFMRLKLRFEAPDRPPAVEVMVNTAVEDLQDEAYKYIEGFRLPCMSRGQSPISASIEFIFDPFVPLIDKPLRLMSEKTRNGEPACLVMPREGINADFGGSLLPVRMSMVHKVFIQADFTGDGTQPPAVKVLFSDADRPVISRVIAQVRNYRMPCRTADSKPVSFSQQFQIKFGEGNSAKFNYDELALLNFLRISPVASKERVYFDLDSMACPFKVRWKLMQPALPNEVDEVGTRDPNRAEFLAWLASRQPAFDAKLSKALIGESMIIQIPCGKIDLNGPASPETAPS